VQANIDNKHLDYYVDYRDNDPDISDFTDEEFMLCDSTLQVFSLDDHEWYLIDINRLKEKVWRPETFNRLVLDQDKKDTLLRLAKTNSRLVQGGKSKDIIEGKGKGIVLLLHGPPGVGKTVCFLLTLSCSRAYIFLVDSRGPVRKYRAAIIESESRESCNPYEMGTIS
jgi:hypothetical protein